MYVRKNHSATYVLDPGVISLPVMPSLQLMPYLGQVHLRTIDHSIMCQIFVRLDMPPLSFTSFYKYNIEAVAKKKFFHKHVCTYFILWNARYVEPLKEERISFEVHTLVIFIMEDVILQIRNKVERTMDLPLYRDDSSTPPDLRNSFKLDVDL